MTQVIRPLLPHKRQRQKKITKKTPNYPIFFKKNKASNNQNNNQIWYKN